MECARSFYGAEHRRQELSRFAIERLRGLATSHTLRTIAAYGMKPYGLKIWLALAVIFVPASQAYLYFGTVDAYPYVIALTIGASMSALLSTNARFRAKALSSTETESTDVEFESKQARFFIRYLAPPLWVFSVALVANRVFDTSPASNYEVRLLAFRTYTKGPSTIQVDSWRNSGEVQPLRYDYRTMSELSSATQLPQPIIVSIRHGAFGWEWVQSVRRR